MIAGCYVNFAICESYDDDIFTVISQLVLTSMSCQDYTQLKSYEKVHRKVSMVNLHFFNNHLELLFLKFDADLIKQIIGLLLNGIGESIFDIQADCTNSLNCFNEFVFEKLKGKRTMKNQDLIEKISQFYTTHGAIFQDILKTSLYTVLFEESRNIWIFQKLLHSSIIIVNQQGVLSDLIIDLLNKHEKSEQRKEAMF